VTFIFSVRLLQVIIVTSSLMKDMNSKTDLYRANAIRVLCRITDGGLLGQIERYLKQAVVDKNPVVSSAALVSGIHLLQVCHLEKGSVSS
jgi:coatomer protein complex subunit gamma